MAERFIEHGFGTRIAGIIDVGEENEAIVEHIYSLEDEACPEGHTHQDPGGVALHVRDGSEHATLFLDEGEALHLAFLLQRAVGWITDIEGGRTRHRARGPKVGQGGRHGMIINPTPGGLGPVEKDDLGKAWGECTCAPKDCTCEDGRRCEDCYFTYEQDLIEDGKLEWDYLKYSFDGPTTTQELASALEAAAAHYRQHADEGWVLQEPVDSGHVRITAPGIEV